MNALYLIIRLTDAGIQERYDIDILRRFGSHSRVLYGTEYPHKTIEDAFEFLRGIALQPQNLHIGYTNIILTDEGTPIYRVSIKTEQEYL